MLQPRISEQSFLYTAKPVNIGQGIFLIFYAVLFSSMLNGISGLHAFPWGFFYESPRGGFRLLWRLIVSIACFYFLPALIFTFSFALLSAYPESIVETWHVPVFVLSSLSVFAPYRLYLLLMIGLRTSPLRLYSRESFEEICAQRRIRRSAVGQFLSLLFFIAAAFLNYLTVAST